jgi:hypothetical protein
METKLLFIYREQFGAKFLLLNSPQGRRLSRRTLRWLSSGQSNIFAPPSLCGFVGLIVARMMHGQ